jgi:uncharacterized radical SAM superfamily Fe-S cluster-containing enzyme
MIVVAIDEQLIIDEKQRVESLNLLNFFLNVVSLDAHLYSSLKFMTKSSQLAMNAFQDAQNLNLLKFLN